MSTSPISAKIASDNLVTWLETEALKLGTDNQRERWAANLLPDDELLKLARVELYKSFEAIPRWHTGNERNDLRKAMIGKHAGRDHQAELDFELAELGELDAKQWDTLKAIQAIAEALAEHPWMFRQRTVPTVTPFTHWATCKRCGLELVASGAKVSMPWAGRVLVREYKL